MDFCFILILIELFVSLCKTQDLLDSIHITDSNPEELNDFLLSVLKHRKTFKNIRSEVAKINGVDINGNQYINKDDKLDKRRSLPSLDTKTDQSKFGPLNDIFPYMYNFQKPINDDRPNRDIDNNNNNRKYRFKRNSSPVNHKYRNVKIEPLSQSGVLIDKNDYEVQQNENKMLRIRSVNDTKIKHNTKDVHKKNVTISKHEAMHNNKTSVNSTSTDEMSPMSTTPAPEFYFTVDHDILGLQQDVQTEWQNETFGTVNPSNTKTKSKTKKDDQLLDSLSPKALSLNIIDSGHVVAKRNLKDANRNSNKLIFSSLNNNNDNAVGIQERDQDEHYIIPVYKNSNLQVKQHVSNSPNNINLRHSMDIYEEPMPELPYENSNMYPAFIANSKLDDLNKLIHSIEERHSTIIKDNHEKKITQTEPTYNRHQQEYKIDLHNKLEDMEYENKVKEKQEQLKKNSLSDSLHKHNIFLEGREKEFSRRTEKPYNNRNLSERKQHSLKVTDSSIYNKINKPTKDKFNVVENKERNSDSHDKNNNKHLNFNFKVIEVDDDMETTTKSTLITERAQLVKQKNYPIYESTKKDILTDYGTSFKSNVTKLSTVYKKVTDSSPYNRQQNKLEDETAPTSAIEQFELERSSYFLNTTLLPTYTDSSKEMFTVRTSGYNEETFQVKEAKDMIHIRNDQLDDINKGRNGADDKYNDINLNDDYNDDIGGDNALDETVDQMKEILDQDIKVRETQGEENLESTSNLLSASDEDLDDELAKISEIQNSFLYGNNKKRNSDRYYVGRKLRSLDLNGAIEESDTLLKNNVHFKNNNVPFSKYGKSLLSDFNFKSLNRKSLIDIANEKIKRNLNTRTRSLPYEIIAENEEEGEEEPDMSFSNKLAYDVKKKIVPESYENPTLFAKSADSIEGQDILNKADQKELYTVEHEPRNAPQLMFSEFGYHYNKDSLFTPHIPIKHEDDTLMLSKGFTKNNEHYDSDPSRQIEESDANYQRYRPIVPKYMLDENVNRNTNQITEDSPTFQNKHEALYYKPKQSIDAHNDKNQYYPPELIIHIIKTENDDLSQFNGDEYDAGHGHRHPPHNKIPPIVNETDREIRNSDDDKYLVSVEGPSIVETLVDPLKEKLKKMQLNKVDVQKRNKLAALTDRQYNISERMMMVPLTLSGNRTTIVRSVNKVNDKNVKPSDKNKLPVDLLNTVQSFKNIVEKTEVNKSKRDATLLSEDPLISIDGLKNNITRRKRKANFFDVNEINDDINDPLWQYHNNMKVLKRNNIDEEKDHKRKAPYKKKQKKSKKKRKRMKNRNRKQNAKISECMMKHHKLKKPPDDIGQIRDVLTGHIAQEIINTLQKRLKKNNRLYNQFGQFILTDEAQKEVLNVDKYRRAQARIEIKHNQMMLHEIIEGLNDIVLAQIHHRLCQHPPPEVKDFLNKITQKSPKRFNLAESLPLPQSSGLLEHQPVDLEDGKFLFPDIKNTDVLNAMDIKKKEKMIKHLLEKYDHMSSKCKVQVEAVRNYLLNHYNMLHELSQSKHPQQDQQEQLSHEVSTQSIKITGEENPSQNVNNMNSNSLNPANLNTAENGGNNAIGAASLNRLISNDDNSLDKYNQINRNEEKLAPPKNLRNVAENDKTNGFYDMKMDVDDLLTGRKKNFLSSRELNKFIEDAMKNQSEPTELDETESFGKRETKPNKTNWNVSNKYKKLIDTAAKIRLKRKTEEKLDKLFGEKLNKPNNENDIKDYSQIKFEAPVVYSLDH